MIAQVDAIINSVGTHLDMSRGALSNAILSAAGDEIQNELMTVAPKFFAKAGSVYVTKGYRLRCRHVLHAVCYSQTDGPQQASVQVYDIVSSKTTNLYSILTAVCSKNEFVHCV